jgi:hypothetical protein
MNVEIGAEAALFPEKEYINGIPLQCEVADIRSKIAMHFCRLAVLITFHGYVKLLENASILF